VVDRVLAGEVDLVLNTPKGGGGQRIDGYEIRTAAVSHGIPCITTLSGILAAIQGIEALRANTVGVRSLQSYLRTVRPGTDNGGIRSARSTVPVPEGPR
jgi:carbamoyl-phosphate synthase large subunit